MRAGRLRQPAAVRHRDHRAEAARERTAERRVVRDRPLVRDRSGGGSAPCRRASYGRSGSSSSGVIGAGRVVARSIARPAASVHCQTALRRSSPTLVSTPPFRSASTSCRSARSPCDRTTKSTNGRRAAPCRRAASESSRPRRSARAAAARVTARQTATACVSCGPGITVTAEHATCVRARDGCATSSADDRRRPDSGTDVAVDERPVVRGLRARRPATTATAAAAASPASSRAG